MEVDNVEQVEVVQENNSNTNGEIKESINSNSVSGNVSGTQSRKDSMLNDNVISNQIFSQNQSRKNSYLNTNTNSNTNEGDEANENINSNTNTNTNSNSNVNTNVNVTQNRRSSIENDDGRYYTNLNNSEKSLNDVNRVDTNKTFQDRVRLRKQNNEDGREYKKDWMDIERKNIQAYEYLCHVEEAKEWIERCIGEEIDSSEFEEQLRKGVILAKLAKIIDPTCVKKIFEAEKLQFRHSDNINYLFTVMRNIKYPENFIFELTDLYDKKNIPKVIYCLHALSHYLEVTGFLHPAVKDFVGKLKFSEEQLNDVQEKFDESGMQLPQFSNVEAAVQKEINLSEEEKKKLYYNENIDKIIKIQSIVRGKIEREKYTKEYLQYKPYMNDIIKIQSITRGHIQRKKYQKREKELKENEKVWIKLQARARAKKVRKEYVEKKNQFKNNEKAIIKLQAFFRKVLARKFYEELKKDKFSINTIQNYIDLISDNQTDLEYEQEMEQLRKNVIKKIRDNIELEKEVSDLDIKIELLIKNQISLQDVVHSSKKKKKIAQVANEKESIFSTKKPDKESRTKYLCYQNLFYLLQTNQKYLAKLLIKLNNIGSPQIKSIENIVMTLFGYAQNNREEYLLLNLIKKTIAYEVEDIQDINEFWRINPIFIKLVLHYCRGAKERQYIRDLLGPLVKSVISSDGLELESDPVSIYKALIREEEYKTGQPSKRKYDVTAKEALSDEETKKVYIIHLQKLKELTTKFLDAIIASLPKMPYGIRCIAMELSTHFMEKWPNNQTDVTKILGNLIYYRYINPAICAPEGFDVLEAAIDQTQRKNLAEISKLLHNISVRRPFADDNPWLQPLNEYIGNAGKKFANFFTKVACVETAEIHFQIDEFNDSASRSNPEILISPKEIINVHSCILEHIEDIELNEKDPLQILLKELGKPLESETSETGISFTLINRFADINENDDSERKLLFRQTKLMIIDILKIQNGTSILDILEKPVTEKEEQTYQKLMSIAKERENKKNGTNSNPESPTTPNVPQQSNTNSSTTNNPISNVNETNEEQTNQQQQQQQQQPSSNTNTNANNSKKNSEQNVADSKKNSNPDISISDSKKNSEHNVTESKNNSNPDISTSDSKKNSNPDISISDSKKNSNPDISESANNPNQNSSESKKDELNNENSNSNNNLTQNDSNSKKSLNKPINNNDNNDNTTKTETEKSTSVSNNFGTFANFKRQALENMAKLEGYNDIKKENGYQSMLNIIGKEIKNNHLQRETRALEIKRLKQTMENLIEKETYLTTQKEAYNNYIDSCRAQYTNNKKSKPKPSIFSKQYYYLKKLEKEGKVPKFGAYQYSADQLSKRGVLVDIEGVPSKTYHLIKLDISSDEIGIFNIVVKSLGKELYTKELTLESLLKAKFDQVQVLDLDGAKVNVNLLLHLINKKFYV